MAIDTYNEIRELIEAKIYLFAPAKLSSGGDLEFLREYIFEIENAIDTPSKVISLQTLRTAILALDDTAVTVAEIRGLSDIFHASDLGATDDIKLDGITSKTILITKHFKLS